MRWTAAVASFLVLALIVGALAVVASPSAPNVDASSIPNNPGEPRVAAGTLPSLNGDVDCDSDVDPVDALKVMRWSAALSVIQTQPCSLIGSGVSGPPNVWGDVDCSGFANSIDALKILRYTVALAYTQTEPCPDIGT